VLKFLLDTNIFVPLEPHTTLDFELNSEKSAQLHKLCQEENHQIFLHPKCGDDIANDKNNERRKLRELSFKNTVVLNSFSWAGKS
jgi:hypothetical protein